MQFPKSKSSDLTSQRSLTAFSIGPGTQVFALRIKPDYAQKTGRECNREWLLKNSHSRGSQKFRRARMPYKRRSRFCWTFSIPRLGQFFQKRGFFNSHEMLQQRLRRDLKHRSESRGFVPFGGPVEVPCWVQDQAVKRKGPRLIQEAV